MVNGIFICWYQNGWFVGDVDFERQKFLDLKFNGFQDYSYFLYSIIFRMQELGQIVEIYMEEDFEGVMFVVFVEILDDGIIWCIEIMVKKVVKIVIICIVQLVVMGLDGLFVDVLLVFNNYIQILGCDFCKNGNGGFGFYVG